MTIGSLHTPPRWHAIAYEQVRAIGLQLRVTGVLLLVPLLFYGALALNEARRTLASNLSHAGHATVNFAYTPEVSVAVAFLALFLPVQIWNDESPARRSYHWSMPISRTKHALTKLLAGWMWLIASTALWLLFVLAIDAVTQRTVGITSSHRVVVGGWALVVPFTAVTIAYLLGSAAAIGARSPLVWIAGVPMIYLGASLVVGFAGYVDAARAALSAFSGLYGASAAMAGQVRVDGALNVQRWLIASALWGGAAAALVYAMSRRRSK